jgi:hypothetical protein
MIMAKVKVVDTFNGWEGPTFDSIQEAQDYIAKLRRAFYAIQGNQNSVFCCDYVPETATWYFNQRCNKFIWGVEKGNLCIR